MHWNARRFSLGLGLVILVAPLTTAGAAPGLATTAAQPSDAADSLRALVAAYEETWNTHDPSQLARYFSADADMIMGNSPRAVGRDAIRESWRGYFDRIADERKGTFAIVSLSLISENVALLNVASTTAGRTVDDEELPTRRARGTWVLVREAGEWLVVAMRGQPAEGEFRSAAGTDK